MTEQQYIDYMLAIRNSCGGGQVVIVDYDGTISDGTHRLNLLPTANQHLTETWLEFNQAAKYDEPIDNTIAVVNALYDAGKIIIVLTGRADHVRDDSEEWLRYHGVKHHHLVMRRATDNRKDTIIKEEFLRILGIGRILCAFDDSPSVIAHFRSLGLTVYAVTDYGDTSKREDLKSHGVETLVPKPPVHDPAVARPPEPPKPPKSRFVKEAF